MSKSIISRDAEIQNLLEEKLGGEDIAQEVAEQALNSGEPLMFIKDLLEHGCISGMVPSLIYYSDTHDFFDLHYDEIESLRLEWEDYTGLRLEIGNNLKNDLAWFAFEEVARQLAMEWGLV